MAIYHLHIKVIGRKSGSSAVASAAYRSASRLRDSRIERNHDFTNKRGVVHSEVLLPDHAPEVWSDREQLWNDVEAFEVRKDAQLAREVEFAIPREMTESQGIELARDFVISEFVDQGMIADLNVHWDRAADGTAKPHAHVMLTMRSVDENGFGKKVREWNATSRVEHWRECWAEIANERLTELDIDARIDHRSFEAQGIDLEPQSKIGAPAQRIDAMNSENPGLEKSDRAEMHREIARQNGERIIANPSLALDAITQQQSTFTRRDMAMFAHRHSDGRHSDGTDQFHEIMNAMDNAPDLVELGKDRHGEHRFTTHQIIEVEQRLHNAGEVMAGKQFHNVSDKHRKAALEAAKHRGLLLSGEQADALSHVTDSRGLSIVVGFAGTGKSAMLGVARDAWESTGFEVRGVALSGIAAEGLEHGSGIASRTIASLEHGWERGRDVLSSNSVLVIDEAGMVGTRQLERVLSHAAHAGAKVVMVGDPQQLQSIEAGAAFRSLHERYGGVEISAVRRQHEDWQRQATQDLATQDLATGGTARAIAAYDHHGMVHEAATRQQARDELIDKWDKGRERDRQALPNTRKASRIILTHTNAEVRTLNNLARQRMREAGDLGKEVAITVERGQRSFASGDRIIFLQNERGLGVKNGTLGTVQRVNTSSMSVRTDDGRSISFDFKDYNQIDHGYAATIHKAQGMTVDRTHILATPGMDAHGSYVALSRHRDRMDLHFGQDDFASRNKLINTLSRDRAKDMATDYMPSDHADRLYAERRGITFSKRVKKIVQSIVPQKAREILDDTVQRSRNSGRDLLSPQEPSLSDEDKNEKALRKARTRALIRHARAVDATYGTEEAGYNATPKQNKELSEARKAFDKVRPHGWQDAETAYRKDRSLAKEAGSGRVTRAIRALQLETEIRVDGINRADSFVQDWNRLRQASARQYQMGDMPGYRTSRASMGEMAKSLERNPQLESLLANRKQELGIASFAFDTGQRLGQQLAFSQGLGIGRGRGIGL